MVVIMNIQLVHVILILKMQQELVNVTPQTQLVELVHVPVIRLIHLAEPAPVLVIQTLRQVLVHALVIIM